MWLIKSEPTTWSWPDQKENQVTHWDGVRNYQANNFMKAMKLGDLCFFYHSNVGKEIVGIVKVVKTHYPDPSDDKGRFGMVDVAWYADFKMPVTLSQIKAHPDLQHILLLKQSRLSVMPIDSKAWKIILHLGECVP
jgi:predicted RNA-binding protein with PUA-like domain